LNVACSYNDVAFVQHLLERGANINNRDSSGFTSLALALRDENVKLAKTLLKFGADVNADLEVCGTHLSIATIKGNSVLVHLLLKYGADPNLSDSDGNTALHLAFSIYSKNIEKY